MYKIEFYVPDSHVEEVKDALFRAGAGHMGNYDRCSWQTEGTGQFRPLEGSDPYIGIKDRTETLKEWKVEMVCDDPFVSGAIGALLEAHPYEEPAYSFIKLAKSV